MATPTVVRQKENVHMERGTKKRGRGKELREKKNENRMKQWTQRKEGLKEGEDEWEKRRIKIHQIQVQISYGECDYYIYLKCTDKLN